MDDYKYSEKRRNDPELLAKVEKIHKARKAMLLKASAALKVIADEMRPLNLRGDHAIYDRCFEAVWLAYCKVSGDAEFLRGIGGETYYGNIAAGRFGDYLEKRDVKLPEVPEVGYEYNIEDTSITTGEKSVRGFWVDDPAKLKVGLKNLRASQQPYVDYGGHVWHTYRIVRREKPKPYEYVEEA